MSLIPEDGTGRADADSYVALDGVEAYAVANGLAWAPTDPAAGEAAIRRATRFIDATYRARFSGYPANGRAQALEWPRRGAYTYVPGERRSLDFYGAATQTIDPAYTYLPANEVPREIKAATCEAAIRELAKPNSLAPDLKQGGAIRSAQAGSASVTFAGAGYSGQQVFQTIDNVLAGLLMPSNAYSGRAVRG